ncbi:EamA family transporter [Virgibacillus sp. Bac330]|uniref:EamA family transporter n=1 Tax=Virgibacillus sp. Bac330 TaxID=2419841 RepID=UPI001F08BE78|nr:EamA family transporter [Virgibacillus sp. Bac330]
MLVVDLLLFAKEQLELRTIKNFQYGLGFLPTAFAYIIYTCGLKDIEASKASILTTVEPVVAR